MLATYIVRETRPLGSLLFERCFLGRVDRDSKESICMHAYFDGYVHSNAMLNESIVQCKKTVHARGQG